MDPKKNVILRKALNKRFEQTLYYQNRSNNPSYTLEYNLVFSISRKVNLNCNVKITNFTCLDPDFIKRTKWYLIVSYFEKHVVSEVGYTLRRLFGVDSDIVNNYFIRRTENVIVKYSESKKRVIKKSSRLHLDK
jgi:hypothetical protein